MNHVKDLMSANPATCHKEDTLNQAAQLMWEHDCGCIPVVDDLNRVVGIVTDRDICMGAYTQGRTLRDVPVSSVCAKQVFTCAPDDSVEKAEALMIKHAVRRLPVTQPDGRLVGVLSISDLAKGAQLSAPAKGDSARGRALSSVMEAVSRLRTVTHAKIKREHFAESARRPAS